MTPIEAANLVVAEFPGRGVNVYDEGKYAYVSFDFVRGNPPKRLGAYFASDVCAEDVSRIVGNLKAEFESTDE